MSLDDTGRDHFRTFRRDGGSIMCRVGAALSACEFLHVANVPDFLARETGSHERQRRLLRS